MTIVAGFKTREGIVLCADTEESVGTISKRNVPKLRFEGLTQADPTDGDMAVAFCGATNNGPFMDEIVDKAWEDVQTAKNLGEACDLIKESLKESHKEFGQIYQPGFLPEAELIYGVKMSGTSRLFYALGPAINEIHRYAAGGAGYYMADFLASRMYRSTLKVRQCIVLAAYILLQAKEHVQGCGGESHIVALRNSSTSGAVDSSHVEAITKLVRTGDKVMSDMLMRYANLGISADQFLGRSREILERLVNLREQERKALVEEDETLKKILGASFTDDLGLPALTDDLGSPQDEGNSKRSEDVS